MIDKLVIDRSKWGSGQLLRSDGRMCCLGHLSRACGVSDEIMGQNTFPLGSWDEVPEWARPPGDLAVACVRINDSQKYGWSDKESLLIPIFASQGITLEFTGEGYQY